MITNKTLKKEKALWEYETSLTKNYSKKETRQKVDEAREQATLREELKNIMFPYNGITVIEQSKIDKLKKARIIKKSEDGTGYAKWFLMLTPEKAREYLKKVKAGKTLPRVIQTDDGSSVDLKGYKVIFNYRKDSSIYLVLKKDDQYVFIYKDFSFRGMKPYRVITGLQSVIEEVRLYMGCYKPFYNFYFKLI